MEVERHAHFNYNDPTTPPDLVDRPVEYVTGYPFMQLAKRHGTDYSDVLICTMWEQPGYEEQAFEANERLTQAARDELAKLLDQPVYLRGAVGHDVV